MASWNYPGPALDVSGMNIDELFLHLTRELHFPTGDMEELQRRCIDGEAFTHLSREDIATIFPDVQKFLMASKLYKAVQNSRIHDDSCTNDLLNELSDLEDNTSTIARSTSSISRQSSSSTTILPVTCPVSRSSDCSTSSTTQKRCSLGSDPLTKKETKFQPDKTQPGERQLAGEESTPFKLPVFSPDIQQCIRKDAFFTNTQRNKLIKEASVALRGYCWQKGIPVSNDEKRSLAKMLYNLAPMSLGDPGHDGKAPESGLYGQIGKWLQNHSYLDRKACGKVKPKKEPSPKSSSRTTVADDEEAMTVHLRELEKEARKKNQDMDKLARLLSLTYASRQRRMAAQTANTRISEAVQQYECLKKPIFLVEMYLAFGQRFTTIAEVWQKCKMLGSRWNEKLVPAICALAEEIGKTPTELESPNELSMYCLRFLAEKLKPRTGKSSVEDRLNGLICFAQNVEEGLRRNKSNTYPYVLCVGTPANVTSAVVVCNRKVITVHIGYLVVSSLMTLLALHYTFDLEYNPLTQQVLQFLQEKVLADRQD